MTESLNLPKVLPISGSINLATDIANYTIDLQEQVYIADEHSVNHYLKIKLRIRVDSTNSYDIVLFVDCVTINYFARIIFGDDIDCQTNTFFVEAVLNILLSTINSFDKYLVLLIDFVYCVLEPNQYALFNCKDDKNEMTGVMFLAYKYFEICHATIKNIFTKPVGEQCIGNSFWVEFPLTMLDFTINLHEIDELAIGDVIIIDEDPQQSIDELLLTGAIKLGKSCISYSFINDTQVQLG